jgi:hypothetical protein
MFLTDDDNFIYVPYKEQNYENTLVNFHFHIHLDGHNEPTLTMKDEGKPSGNDFLLGSSFLINHVD